MTAQWSADDRRHVTRSQRQPPTRGPPTDTPSAPAAAVRGPRTETRVPGPEPPGNPTARAAYRPPGAGAAEGATAGGGGGAPLQIASGGDRADRPCWSAERNPVIDQEALFSLYVRRISCWQLCQLVIGLPTRLPQVSSHYCMTTTQDIVCRNASELFLRDSVTIAIGPVR